MPTLYTSELEVIILLILLAFYSEGSPSPSWPLAAEFLAQLLTEIGHGNTITADALRQHVTKKMMKRGAYYLRAKEFFARRKGGNEDRGGNSDDGAGGAAGAGTAA